MWQLLIPLALWLGAVGLGRAELTAAQQRGLQVALEEFHKHPPVQWAFKETSVDRAEDTPFPAGTFVRLEFKLQQTSCRKKDWKKANCKIKPNGRKRKCLACIKLNSADKVLGRMVHCPIHTQVHQSWVPLPGQLQEVTSKGPPPVPELREDNPIIPELIKVLSQMFSPLACPPSPKLNCGIRVLQEEQSPRGSRRLPVQCSENRREQGPRDIVLPSGARAWENKGHPQKWTGSDA
uniref:Retinoic acid receptor responder protein 2 n=1 Tax=Canis lupus dingo TaxID=286419 RepID=A0A8C0K0T5_CANLU